MTTFITRLESSGPGPTLAVKDIIDVAGVPTTAGSRAVAEYCKPAQIDAACMVGARAAGVRVVGKANLFELAYGASGINEWFGTPANPLDPRLVPGGSSSGSAVAVATGEADVAYGTDTGGSVRIPSAFCGTVGLKTTHGRISLTGVWPLAPSLDTVGPMATDVDGVIRAMALLEPGFVPAPAAVTSVGRLMPRGVSVDPRIDAALDSALVVAGLTIEDIDVPSWRRAYNAGGPILDSEAAASNRPILLNPERRAKLGPAARARLEAAEKVGPDEVLAARAEAARWRTELATVFTKVPLIALPAVGFYPPPISEAFEYRYTELTLPVNVAGVPSIVIPVPSAGALPASLQLIGPLYSEEVLVATAHLIEAALHR